MHLSTLSTSLGTDFALALRQATELGFKHIDVVGLAERPAADLEALAETGLLVSCVALGRGLPSGQTLDSVSLPDRRLAVATVERQLSDAALLGATHVYLVPGIDPSAAGLTRFADACRHLADVASTHMIRLCVEPVPGRALGEAATTLAWLASHPNLALLLDIGHCTLSGEEAARVIEQAGPRLGYVHFDDNDGIGDMHWPLLSGKLTEEQLRSILAALAAAKYAGALSLELSGDNPRRVDALRQDKALLERLLAEQHGCA